MNDSSLQDEGRAQAQSIEALLDALTAPFTQENTDADEIAEALEACGDSATTQQGRIAHALDYLNENTSKDSRAWNDRVEEAEQAIREDPLSLNVRSCWHELGGDIVDMEFCIELSTGGPAARIIGDLGDHCEPVTARLQVQCWGTPWTDVCELSRARALEYACQFCWEGARE